MAGFLPSVLILPAEKTLSVAYPLLQPSFQPLHTFHTSELYESQQTVCYLQQVDDEIRKGQIVSQSTAQPHVEAESPRKTRLDTRHASLCISAHVHIGDEKNFSSVCYSLKSWRRLRERPIKIQRLIVALSL